MAYLVFLVTLHGLLPLMLATSKFITISSANHLLGFRFGLQTPNC